MGTVPRVLDVTEKQTVRYAVPTWLRDEQIRLNIQLVKGRVEPVQTLRHEPIAVVGFGPSLNETWEQVRDFKAIISCSGAHKFLIERGIIPTFHIEVDPRQHKIQLIGQPHQDVQYLIASACHPEVVKYLSGYNVRLWHVFDTSEEGQRILPAGEWSVTGGCSVGLRAMTMARLLGYTDLHIFGIDGSEGKTGKHADTHPNQAKESFETVYKGVTYRTTPAFLEAARTTFHELDQMVDVKATFYGEGLVQHMAQHYKPKKNPKGDLIAFEKPELISDEYRALNAQLHRDNLSYGVGAGKHVPTVQQIIDGFLAKKVDAIKKAVTHNVAGRIALERDGIAFDPLPVPALTSADIPRVLDYGSGKGYLAKDLPFVISEYDPAMPGKQEQPKPADLVVCFDVLEHIEPEKLKYVLKDLKRCTLRTGYFVINTGPAQKVLADGRNAHLIQQKEDWWRRVLSSCFNVESIFTKDAEIHAVVSPLKGKHDVAHAVSVVSAQTLRITLGGTKFRREPYLIGAASNVLSDVHYARLVATFPTDLAIYKKFAGSDEKFSLSERNNPEAYGAFLQSSPPWMAFHDYVKSETFIDKAVRLVTNQGVTLGVKASELRSRFEFSILPANGGYLRPHTDIPSKVITLVIAMRGRKEEWEPSWGGGTAVMRQTDPSQHYDDYAAPDGALEIMHTYDYQPNQCIVFVKTENSWHAVPKMTGPEGKLRRTVTINLERAQ